MTRSTKTTLQTAGKVALGVTGLAVLVLAYAIHTRPVGAGHG